MEPTTKPPTPQEMWSHVASAGRETGDGEERGRGCRERQPHCPPRAGDARGQAALSPASFIPTSSPCAGTHRVLLCSPASPSSHLGGATVGTLLSHKAPLASPVVLGDLQRNVQAPWFGSGALCDLPLLATRTFLSPLTASSPSCSRPQVEEASSASRAWSLSSSSITSICLLNTWWSSRINSGHLWLCCSHLHACWCLPCSHRCRQSPWRTHLTEAPSENPGSVPL